jgi:MFS family permease
MAGIDGRSTGVLLASNLLGGVGVASGVAVGALLVERTGGTSVAGLGQAASVLGAAVAAVPLATMATRRGRRWSLSVGYVLAVLGAVGIITAAVLSQILLLLASLGLFGVAQAVNLQSRYAAADNAPIASRARTMSIVIWATTVGSVAGPNLSAVGTDLGDRLGIPSLAGPYLFSVVAFGAAAALIALVFRPSAAASAPPAVDDPVDDPAADPVTAPRAVGSMAALRWAAGHRTARFGVVLIAVAHAVMVMVMVMTPLHMQHHGMSLELVGIVISVHVLGMYVLSPVFGWVADRFGAVRLAVGGLLVLAAAVVLGLLAASAGGSSVLTGTALTVLGVGWSCCVISASSLLASVSAEEVRVPLQGATDAGMNYAGACAAALAGPILAWGGFAAVNVAAAVLLVPAVVLLAGVLRALVDGDGRAAADERGSAARAAERAASGEAIAPAAVLGSAEPALPRES